MANSNNGEPAADTYIANRITTTLAANEMSLLALSEETGIAYPTLRRSIKAGRSLSIQEIAKIADALQVPPSTFMPATFAGDAA